MLSPRTFLSTGALATAAPPVLFVLIWSSGYLVGDIGTRAGSPFALLFWRFAVATVLLVIAALITRAPWPRDAGTWVRLLVIGVLLQSVQFGGVYLALSLGASAGFAALVVSASPLVIAALAVPLFGERMVGRQWIGLALGLLGVAFAVSAELSGTANIGAVLLIVLGLAGFVGGTLFQKHAGREMDLRTGTAIQALGGAVSIAPVAALHGGLGLPLTAAALGSVAWLAVVNSIGGFTLLFVLLRRRQGGSATSYLFLVPPATALLGVPLLGQPVSIGAIAGIAFAAVGVAMVTRTGKSTVADPDAESTNTESTVDDQQANAAAGTGPLGRQSA